MSAAEGDNLKVNMKGDAAKKIGFWASEQVENLQPAEIHELLASHFKTLRLLSSTNEWAAPELKAIEHVLLPETTTSQDLRGFIDDIVNNIEQNEYLMSFLHVCSLEKFEKLKDSIENQNGGANYIPSVITYGFALEKLTNALYEDVTVLKACHEIWKVIWDDKKELKEQSVFFIAKFASVEFPIKKFIEFHESGKVPENFTRILLPTNIYEAVAKDKKIGNMDNASAGRTLARAGPNSRKYNESCGTGPARFSDDKKGILIYLPLGLKWTNLYVTWNMAFISHLSYWPYVIMKLLIPKVSNYQACPSVYIYNRALALYVWLHYSYYYRIDLKAANTETPDWTDESLTAQWGAENKKSAGIYQNELDKHKSDKHGLIQWILDMLNI